MPLRRNGELRLKEKYENVNEEKGNNEQIPGRQ